MRYITKNANYSDRHLDKAARHTPVDSKDASRCWRNLNKDILYRNLFAEQYGLCAYTELNIQDFRVENASKKGAHIEHIKPKGQYLSETFNYMNLVLSVMDSDDLSKFDELNQFDGHRFGGHHKLSDYDERQFLSPLLPNISEYFAFSSENGDVFPAVYLNDDDKSKADYTIKLLNLNAPYLKNLRKNWLRELEDEIDKLIEARSTEGLKKLAECELMPYEKYDRDTLTSTSQLRQFHSASLKLFNGLGRRVLAQAYPQGL